MSEHNLIDTIQEQAIRIRSLTQEVEALKGTLATESAERIRCRDGWAKAEAEVARLRRVEDAARACFKTRSTGRNVFVGLMESEADTAKRRIDVLEDALDAALEVKP